MRISLLASRVGDSLSREFNGITVSTIYDEGLIEISWQATSKDLLRLSFYADEALQKLGEKTETLESLVAGLTAAMEESLAERIRWRHTMERRRRISALLGD